METCQEVADRQELLRVMSESLAPWDYELKPETVKVEPYHGRDDRIGWEATYIITIVGHGVWGFSDQAI